MSIPDPLLTSSNRRDEVFAAQAYGDSKDIGTMLDGWIVKDGGQRTVSGRVNKRRQHLQVLLSLACNQIRSAELYV